MEKMSSCRPIGLLADTPMYEKTLQTCWHMGTYKSQIAVMVQLLNLQRRGKLPSELSSDDMIELLVEQNKQSLRVKLWEFDLEKLGTVTRSLLKLLWNVNTKIKMRDVEFEARNLLESHKSVPPEFKISRFRKLSETYAHILFKHQRQTPIFKLLCPQEVVMEVVPHVLLGFWLPPSNTSMPYKTLSPVVVGITKVVGDRVSSGLSDTPHQVLFSRFTRDATVKLIQEKVRKASSEKIQIKGMSCFTLELLNSITDTAIEEISLLFHTPANPLGNADCFIFTPPTASADPPTNTEDLVNHQENSQSL